MSGSFNLDSVKPRSRSVVKGWVGGLVEVGIGVDYREENMDWT